MLFGRGAVQPVDSRGEVDDEDSIASAHIRPGTILHEAPELVKWRIVRSALTRGPTLKETYGESPAHYVVAVVVHGPGPQGALLSQNITNKAVISALFLTFNYPALFAAADLVRDGADEAQTDSALFRAYFAFQLLSVVAAFCVMISAAIFVSHVLRCGQHVDSLIAYLRKALWIDNAFNEFTFIGQCGCTILAVQTYITLYFRGGLAWAAAGLFGLIMISLIVMLLWSTEQFHIMAQHEWEELCEAEAELRKRVGGSRSDEPGAEPTGEPGARGPRDGAALAGEGPDGVGSGKGKEM